MAKERKEKLARGPLAREDIISARNHWVSREQRCIIEMKETLGWKLIRVENSAIIRCVGRMHDYQPICLERSLFKDKLIRHMHRSIMHMGVASTMGASRDMVSPKYENNGQERN